MNNCLIYIIYFGSLSTYLFLNIFTDVEIEKTVENCKPRSRYVWKEIKIEFPLVSRPFMTLFSLFRQIIFLLWDKTPIHRTDLFACVLFFLFADDFCSIMPFIFNLHPKNKAFIFFQTFSRRGLQFSSLVCCKHSGRFNFQLIFVAFTIGFIKKDSFYLQTDTWLLFK